MGRGVQSLSFILAWHNIPTCLKNLNVYLFSNQIKLYLLSEQLEISMK